MKLNAPAFWWPRKLATRSKFLMPIGMIYGFVTGLRMKRAPDQKASLPVICIGNLVIGGAGKTPTTISISYLLQTKGYRCGFLLRGYGGSNEGATRVTSQHSVHEVGDEALLYAEIGPTVVSADRGAGASLLSATDIDIILMDDGFQNPALHKACSLIVVDGLSGWGNGLCFPAGPLRASLNAQLPFANAVIALGQGEYSESLEMLNDQHEFQLLQAEINVPPSQPTANTNGYLAYSGIGRPQKFFTSLEQNGFGLKGQMSFPDHHVFSETDAKKILQKAQDLDAVPITTQKDHVRLASAAPKSSCAELFETSEVLKITVEFSEPGKLVELLEAAIASNS